MAMDAMLATIANGGQEIYNIDREAGRNKLIYCLIHHFKLNPLMAALANPFCRGTWGWGMFCHTKNHASNKANSSIMVGMFACCVFCQPNAFQVGVFYSCQKSISSYYSISYICSFCLFGMSMIICSWVNSCCAWTGRTIFCCLRNSYLAGKDNLQEKSNCKPCF